MRPAIRRRGVNLIGLLLIVLAMAGVGMGLSNLSRQAGRSGHWFFHGQIAHDLADGALKQAFYMMTQANGLQAAQAAPVASAELTQIYQMLTTGSGATVKLLSSGGTVTPLLQDMLDRLKDYSPSFEVTVTPVASQPLWTGLKEGIPAVAGERLGGIQIVARAAVKSPAGIPLERVITLEKQYKVINPLPPLLGRFSIFVAERGADEVNTVPMKFDPNTGDAAPDGAPRPLVLEGKTREPLVTAGTPNLDRARFAGTLDPKHFDKSGWVYLGGTAAQPWKLRLAHGFSEFGESPFLPGYRSSTPVLFRGSAAENRAFGDRLTDSFRIANRPCLPGFKDNTYGLYQLFHGFAQNYEIISLDTPLHRRVQTGGARAPVMDFGPGETSSLRLFGTTDAALPTLVFGPVYRVVMRRASLKVGMGPPLVCPAAMAITVTLPLHKLEALPPIQRGIYNNAFQGDYPKFGTGIQEDTPYVAGLNVVLSSQGSGAYLHDGTLGQTGAPATDKQFNSDLLPWLGPVSATPGLSQQLVDRMMNGDLDSDKVYKGNLGAGLKAFIEALKPKITFDVSPEAVTKKMIVGKTLKVPGVVVIKSGGPLALGNFDKVEGGILIAANGINITGDIVRGSAKEPLTLVAEKGDITIDPAAKNIEAVLVALDGKVKFAGDVTISGGVAGKQLDVKGLANPGKRKIKHSEDMDPTGPNKDLLKVYYGGEDKLMVAGGGS